MQPHVSLSFTISQRLLRLMFLELVMPSNHLILCHPLLLLPSIFPSIGAFSNELAISLFFLWCFSTVLSLMSVHLAIWNSLLLSHFSRVRLCVTPSLGFSRQEHWSGLPFPSPVHKSEKWKWSHSVMFDSSRPHGLQPTRLLCPWDFPGESTGVGCHCLLRLELSTYYQHPFIFSSLVRALLSNFLLPLVMSFQSLPLTWHLSLMTRG